MFRVVLLFLGAVWLRAELIAAKFRRTAFITMSDWDDDEVDYDAKIEQQLRRKAGGSSDSESEPDATSPVQPKSESKPKEAAPKPKPKPKSKKGKFKPLTEPAVDSEVLLDPIAEKLRQQKLQEEADARLAADLFGVPVKEETEMSVQEKETVVAKAPVVRIEKRDAFDSLQLKSKGDLEEFGSLCADKVSTGKAKGAASKFLVDILKALESHLDMTELAAFDKNLTTVIKAKALQKTTTDANKRKGNEVSKGTKFNVQEELSTQYGGAGYEDWDEDWDEYYEQ